ncbi:MAG: acyl-CoA thioesterase, partial [Planctomycetota bacterium]
IAVSVSRLGTTSLDFRFEARSGAHAAAWAVVTKVCVDLDTLRPTPLPADLRAVVERYRVAP